MPGTGGGYEDYPMGIFYHGDSGGGVLDRVNTFHLHRVSIGGRSFMPNNIEKLGFTKADTRVRKRLIVGVEAREKCGKTNFVLTAPGPIVLFDFNDSLEGVIHKFADDKDIYVSDYTKTGNILSPDAWVKAWEQFKKEYISALKSPDVRSVDVDTATEQWELIRMARFGKILQVMPHMYAPVNAEFRDLIYMAYSSNKNLILTHKKKEEYVADKKNPAISNRTGKYIRSGFSDSAYMVQVNLNLDRDDQGFVATILDCRQNPFVVGLELRDEMINFPTLASLVLPETSEGDWV